MTNVNSALETIRTVIDSNVVDVWEKASGRERTAEQRIFFNDLRFSGGIFPKMFFEVEGVSNDKLNWGGRKDMHKNKEQVSLNIYYVNSARMKYDIDGTIYENGGANISKDLNWYMRELIRDKLIEKARDLSGINNLRFGSMTSTEKNQEIFVGVLPVTFSWIRKIGG